MGKYTIKDLTRIIIDSYPLDLVDFENEYPNERYCIRMKNGKWQVYYSQKGQKTGLREFEMESDASEHLLSLIRNVR